jgi:hypothetical protein
MPLASTADAAKWQWKVFRDRVGIVVELAGVYMDSRRNQYDPVRTWLRGVLGQEMLVEIPIEVIDGVGAWSYILGTFWVLLHCINLRTWEQ